jgi:hypothetical protein
MDEPMISRALTKEQAEELAHRSAGARADIEGDEDGTFRLTARGPETLSPDLQNGLQNALRTIGIAEADADAAAILTYAARLTPDDNEPPISTTRLFAGAVAVGQARLGKASYVATLATAIKNDPGFWKSHEDMARLFQREPAEAAARRLQSKWFSSNVTQILNLAASEGKGVLQGDAIVRALFKYRRGLVYRRIQMERVASAVELLFKPPSGNGDGTKPRLMDEVNAALAALEIEAMERVRSYLVRAAAYRRQEGELHPRDLLSALLEAGRRPAAQSRPTDASTMFVAAIDRRGRPIPPGLTAQQANDSSSVPLLLAGTTESLLRRAHDKQQRIFLNPLLGAKGLVAGLLTIPPNEIADDSDLVSIDFGEIRSRFLEVVHDRLAGKPDQIRQWSRALEFETATLPELNNDQAGLGQPRDKLGITNDALAIANVAAGKNTNLPLAFGIFGDWGAGKTFFMRLIQDQIAGFVASPAKDDGFEHAIVQIQFNAWHYAETNLWASLVGHIFDELDRWMIRDESKGDAKSADQILKRLATSRQLTYEAAVELVQRRKEHAKASQALGQAQEKLTKAQEDAAHAPITVWRAAVTTARNAIMGDDELKQQFGAIRDTLGVPNLIDDKAKLTAALDELNRSTSAGNAALGALRATLGGGTVWLAIAALIGVPLLLFILHQGLAHISGWSGLAEAGRGFEALGGLLTMLAVLIHSFSGKLKALTDKFTHLKQSIDAEITTATQAERQAAVDAATRVGQSVVEVEKAKTLVQATGEQVVAALKEYAEETGTLRLRRFVRARAGAEGYGKHLGLVSTIRKDFEQLQSLMLKKADEKPPEHLEQARKHYEARVNDLIKEAGAALEQAERDQLLETAKSIRDFDMPAGMAFRRIVLYIDDLDRCEPDKVVEVLQAVNMLLSFELFVVMVAVDARWLSRSLETRYPDFFGGVDSKGTERPKDKGDEKPKNKADEKPNEDTDDKKPKDNGDQKPNGKPDESGIGRATAGDYLEKIFQIPYWVPPMSRDSSIALVDDLVTADRIAELATPRPEANDSQSQKENGDQQRKAQEKGTPDDEDNQQESMAPPSRALGLTGDEIKTLTALSPFLGGSPRRARRFVNVYRVAKASLTPGEVKMLEDGDHRALATQLAIATGAPNAFGVWVKACEIARFEPHSNMSEGKRIASHVDALPIDEAERQNIAGALKTFCDISGREDDALKDLIAQEARASRFSFVAPRRTSIPAASDGASTQPGIG